MDYMRFETYNDNSNENYHQQEKQIPLRNDFQQNEYNYLNDIPQPPTPTSITARNDLHNFFMEHVMNDGSRNWDYLDFNDEPDIPSSSSNYDSDPDEHTYRNVQYKRDVKTVRRTVNFIALFPRSTIFCLLPSFTS